MFEETEGSPKFDNTEEQPCAKPKFKAKRDIIRFEGERPTAINLEYVTVMYVEGKRITFEFDSKAQYIECADEAAAKSTFEILLTSWASDVVE